MNAPEAEDGPASMPRPRCDACLLHLDQGRLALTIATPCLRTGVTFASGPGLAVGVGPGLTVGVGPGLTVRERPGLTVEEGPGLTVREGPRLAVEEADAVAGPSRHESLPSSRGAAEHLDPSPVLANDYNCRE